MGRFTFIFAIPIEPAGGLADESAILSDTQLLAPARKQTPSSTVSENVIRVRVGNCLSISMGYRCDRGRNAERRCWLCNGS